VLLRPRPPSSFHISHFPLPFTSFPFRLTVFVCVCIFPPFLLSPVPPFFTFAPFHPIPLPSRPRRLSNNPKPLPPSPLPPLLAPTCLLAESTLFPPQNQRIPGRAQEGNF
jgi:hypothetical protein